ncbi:MAG: DUF5667 domain-containing protein [bacterium]
MKENFNAEEKSYSAVIEKIKTLEDVKPNNNWVDFCRENLVIQMKIEHKKELFAKDTKAAQGFFAFLRKQNTGPSVVFRAAYALLLVVFMILAGGGLTAWAAMKSLPGGALYPLKIAIEKSRLIVASAESKSQLRSEIANRRLEELKTVLASQESGESKNERAMEAVGYIQQQLVSVREELPRVSQKEPEKMAIAVKAVGERADQMEKALVQVKEGLSDDVRKNVGEKMTEAAEMAEKTSTQALEIMVNSAADKDDIIAKVEEKIKLVEQKIAVATSTADKLPIRAVLIRDQSDKAMELLNQAKDSLQNQDASGALQTIKLATEIVNSTERIVESAGLQNSLEVETKTNAESDQQASSSTPPDALK